MPSAGTRISPYQARIERSLVEGFTQVPTQNQAGREWVLTGVGYLAGSYTSCEMCGHAPIKRLFYLHSGSQDHTMVVGSECARNYVRVDLVEAYERQLTRHVTQRRQERQREARRAARVEQQRQYQAEREARQQAQATAWQSIAANAQLIEDMRRFRASNSVLDDMLNSYAQYGRLTDRQQSYATSLVQRHIAASSTIAPAGQGNAADRAARPEHCPHIYNGGYTLDDGTGHLSYRIRTITNRQSNLYGLRVVQRQLQYGEYASFAFVNQDGTLGLWRRFQSEEQHRYVVWARVLLSILNGQQQAAQGIDRITAPGAPGTSTTWTVNRTRSCRRCNRNLTTPASIEAGIGPECQTREHDRTTATNQHALTNVEPISADAVLDAVATNRAFAYAARRPAPAPAPAPRQLVLAMSEVDSSMVQ